MRWLAIGRVVCAGITIAMLMAHSHLRPPTGSLRLASAGGRPAASRSHADPGAPATRTPATVAEALVALADQNDPAQRRRAVLWLARSGTMQEIPALVGALRDPDPYVRAFTEGAMWEIWSRSGDAETDRLFTLGVEQMNGRDVQAAIDTFTRIIERQPEFAEGWNKRATAYFLAGEYRKSLADCDEVLRLNPYHFGALSGIGMNYVQLDQPEQALAAFERALGVNPNMRQVEQSIEVLKELLAKRRPNTIDWAPRPGGRARPDA